MQDDGAPGTAEEHCASNSIGMLFFKHLGVFFKALGCFFLKHLTFAFLSDCASSPTKKNSSNSTESLVSGRRRQQFQSSPAGGVYEPAELTALDMSILL